MTELGSNRADVILELGIDPRDLTDASFVERWEWPCGTEAITRRARVIGMRVVEVD